MNDVRYHTSSFRRNTDKYEHLATLKELINTLPSRPHIIRQEEARVKQKVALDVEQGDPRYFRVDKYRSSAVLHRQPQGLGRADQTALTNASQKFPGEDAHPDQIQPQRARRPGAVVSKYMYKIIFLAVECVKTT